MKRILILTLGVCALAVNVKADNQARINELLAERQTLVNAALHAKTLKQAASYKKSIKSYDIEIRRWENLENELEGI